MEITLPIFKSVAMSRLEGQKMINSQSQKGGDGSTNFQAQQVVFNVGVDEKRAREICEEMHLHLRKEYSREALAVANLRVEDFENRLMQKMSKVEGALEAFADPAFQLLLLDAQRAAASTERPVDYDLLSELLIHRFQKGDNRAARAGINLAVEIVDKVSDESLLGLTAAHAISSFFPASGNIGEGLDVLDNLFGKVIYGELPEGMEWLDHLDVLGAIRVTPMSSMKKIDQYYPEQLPGYIDVGIEKDSDNYKRAIELIKGAGLPIDLLISHELNESFSRLCVRARDAIDMLTIRSFEVNNGLPCIMVTPFSEAQKEVVKAIYGLYSNDGAARQANVNIFIEKWNQRPHLKKLREWWDRIPTGFNVTSVGKVLAHSNAQRCDNSLPAMN